MSHSKQKEIVTLLNNKTATIGIVGLGYVGLPLSIHFSLAGYKVLGFDINQNRVDSLNRAQSPIKHISHELLQTAIKKGFSATVDTFKIQKVDAIILCVPTPLNKYREPDLSFVLTTLNNLLPYLRANQVLSLESTTYPGTTEEELKPRIEQQGFQIGKDFFLIYSPEREDPGNLEFNTVKIPKVCGGITPACLKVGEALYNQVMDRVVPVSNTKVAEMTKLLENIHRAVNIGLVNEMKIVANKMGIDIREVIDAAATKPFGFVPYYPGPGIGGHCIPIDPSYLTWKAREYGMHTRFIELAGEINNHMPKWVIWQLSDALNEKRLSIKGSKILILGIAYKKNVDDVRESPSVAIMEILAKKGAAIDYSDPNVPTFPSMREHHFDLHSIEITPERISSYDAVILATAHRDFNYDLIKEHAKLIIDTRGVYHSGDNVIKA